MHQTGGEALFAQHVTTITGGSMMWLMTDRLGGGYATTRASFLAGCLRRGRERGRQ